MTWNDWLRGDLDAIKEGRAALKRARAFHRRSTSIRQAVETWQKRRGYSPTGWLTPEQWAELTQTEEEE